MSNLWLPPQRRNVQLSGKERVCVLVHRKTKRILCFAKDDWFADSFAKDYEKIEILHASSYDKWSKRYRDQAGEENAAEDYAKLQREDAVRQKLRGQLADRLNVVTEAHEKAAIVSALKCLDLMQQRKQRYREESFMANEGFEATKNVGEEIVSKAMKNA